VEEDEEREADRHKGRERGREVERERLWWKRTRREGKAKVEEDEERGKD